MQVNVMLPSLFESNTNGRKRQINTLKVFNANVIEITEDAEYQITFRSGRNEFCLQVSLSGSFPKERPVLRIIPRVAHPWVSGDGEITSAPGLLNFTEHSDLGRVVQAIIRDFQRNPPDLQTSSTTLSPSVSILHPEPTSQNLASYSNYTSFSPPVGTMPVQSSQNNQLFPQLEKLSLNELQFLSENEDRFQEFLDQTPYIREQNKQIDDHLQQIEDLAESNLSQEKLLQDLHKTIDEKIENVTKLAFENERLHVLYCNQSSQYSPRSTQDKLAKAAQEAEEQCDKISEAFLNGELDVEKFVSSYIKTKTLCQIRKTKEEKLAEQLDGLDRAGY